MATALESVSQLHGYPTVLESGLKLQFKIPHYKVGTVMEDLHGIPY
jgi:hypothetical protein